ncbi:MAG: trypsin-like serine peptidase [Hasllibacter sp.]
MRSLLIALLAIVPAALQAQAWGGVGRLDIGESRLCTGSLIAPDLVLTAAHCVIDAEGRAVPAARVTFRAGLNGSREEATRRARGVGRGPGGAGPVGASALDLVPGDVAVLALDRPVTSFRAAPLEVGPAPFEGASLRLVSYAAGRAEAVETQEGCALIERAEGILVTSCAADLGASGSPLIDDQGRIVGVLSASALREGATVGLGVDLQGALLGRLSAEARAEGAPRPVIRRFGAGGDGAGARGTARFVRP